MKKELLKHKLLESYNQRPYYQRRDYIIWIGSAMKDETKLNRTAIMIDDLKTGKYMKMKYKASHK